MPRRHLTRAACALLGLALLLAACGDDEPGSELEAGTEGTEEARTATAESPPPPTLTAAASTPTAPPTAAATPDPSAPLEYELTTFTVPPGARPHDVAPAVDGGVWYTAQRQEALGYLDPASGETRHIPLGAGSAPHGVIVGPEGAPWITDGGLNAIVRVDPASDEVTIYPLPAERAGANLNTAVFDARGRIWFTGQTGIYGVLDPATEEMQVFDAPGGRGPYGITSTADGNVIWYASLAGSHIARIDIDEPAVAEQVQPPTAGQGARRVWADSHDRVWVSEWNAGQVAVYDPATEEWREWPLPGAQPQTYAVYVDERDAVWLSDFGANAIVRFDPLTEQFESFPLPGQPGDVRQIHGRPGEVWAPESASDQIVRITFEPAE